MTAGNSSQICDGAAAVLVASESAAARLGLEARARFVSFGLSGVDPHRMLHGNPQACDQALERAGLTWDDISVIEVNEAFASVVLQFARDAGLEDRWGDINPNGGGISLGHPLGATGARMTATLLNELERREGTVRRRDDVHRVRPGDRLRRRTPLIVTLRSVGEMAGRALAREPKEIVARGYDAIALRYAEWAGQIDSPAMAWVRELDAQLDDGADVLELGCGRGVPATRELARRHRVTGVDISAVQIELARHHVPEASFVHSDAMELEIAPASFDAVVALFVFGHVPVEEQAGLIARISLWLRDGGFFLGTFATGEAGQDVDDDWLGVPMFFASLGGDAYAPLLRDAGLEPLRDEVVVQNEPGHGDISFRWFLARAAA